MKKLDNIFNRLSVEDIKLAAERAIKGHRRKPEVIRFRKNFDKNCEQLFTDLINGNWKNRVKYIKLVRINPGNNKTRYIDSPSFITRIYQHLFLNLVEPVYFKKDNRNALNCKNGCGITADDKKKSVVKKLKHVFYDRLDLNYYLVIDQRKCYDHITEKTFRRMLKRLVRDKWLIDFGVGICFINHKLPIGTPTSPMVHHIVMLTYDYLAKQIAPFSVRYADDNFLAFHTKDEANEAKWRIKNFWWYEMGIRAKKHTTVIKPFTLPHDFCGYIFHRNSGKKWNDHNKGYTIIRENIQDRANDCSKLESWAAYFGILKHADSFKFMESKELTVNSKKDKPMDLWELTKKVKIKRDKLDAVEIEAKELVTMETIFTIYDYEIRESKGGQNDWIKVLIGIKEIDESGNETGRILARQFHGSLKNIITYLKACEREFQGKKFLPITNAQLRNSSGVYISGTIDFIKYINEQEYEHEPFE